MRIHGSKQHKVSYKFSLSIVVVSILYHILYGIELIVIIIIINIISRTSQKIHCSIVYACTNHE